MSDKAETSYKRILKSTSVVGGAQIVQIMISIVRTKIIAILLGTAGVGLIGLYQSILDLARNLTSMGINMSGVRDVAEAQKGGDQECIAKTALVLKRWSWATGLFGLFVVLVFCSPFSHYSFGNNSYALNIAILSISLIFTSLFQYQLALIQGMQLYSKFAKSNVAISLASLIISVPLFYFLGSKAIVPSLVIIPATTLMITFWFVRKLHFIPVKLSSLETFVKGLRMTKLGIFMVINGFLASGTLLFIKSYISTNGGINPVGLFQASWMISTIYIGIVLNAMLIDFFPRMSANSHDNALMNRLTNEQCEITLILGAPLLMILMAFSPTVLKLLYSGAFAGAVILLQWLVAGSFLVLISWPVGVIFLAKGKGIYSLALDFSGSLCFIIIGVLIWRYFGIVGFGISAFIRAFISIIVVLILGRKASGFAFTSYYIKLAVFFTVPFMICFILSLLKINYISITVNIILTISIVWISFKMLSKRVDINTIFKNY